VMKSQLDELEPRTGANRDLSADLDGMSGRKTGRARPVDDSPPIGARGRWPLGHGRPPRSRERSRRIPTGEPDGVIAKVKRRRCACSSADAGTLHPAITSHQVSPKRGFAPFESPGTRHGPGAFAVSDDPQPSPRTGQNRRTNLSNVRGARNAEPDKREARGNPPVTREGHWPPLSSRRCVTNSCASEACP
jgi:hypothetical protein